MKSEDDIDAIPDDEKTKSVETPKSSVTPIDEIKDAINNIITESENNITLAEMGSLLGKLFTDFDVRNYDYTKLNIFIRDQFPNVLLEEKNGTVYVKIKNDLDVNTVKREIIEIIKKSGGSVKPLSQILDELIKKHENFKLGNYGPSKISKFLKNIDGIEVDGNKVKLKGKK